jgi:transposase-like protein
LEVPYVREGGFQPLCLERYRRCQRVVDRVLLEAFLLGHAIRKVRRWCRRLCGVEISSQTVSNIVRELDQGVQQFHCRRFGDGYRFVYVDGLWITLRKPVKAKKVLLVAGSESESWWGAALK